MRSTQSVEQRFWAKVAKTDGCWNWQGTKNRGYGSLHGSLNGVRKTLKAHRVSYEMHHGPIPQGMEVMHSCDNPSCVNPAHLSVGTKADNMRDAAAKGRTCTIGHSRLTHCPHGHEYTSENTYLTKLGHRKCKACVNLASAKRHHSRHPTADFRKPEIAAAIRKGTP